jgi:hypothetical protein
MTMLLNYWCSNPYAAITHKRISFSILFNKDDETGKVNEFSDNKKCNS